MRPQEWKEQLVNKYRDRIRAKAIAMSKSRIALAGKKIQSFTEEELEAIVAEEEGKLKNEYLKMAGFGFLLLLGLG